MYPRPPRTPFRSRARGCGPPATECWPAGHSSVLKNHRTARWTSCGSVAKPCLRLETGTRVRIAHDQRPSHNPSILSHSGLRPFHRKSTCTTQITLGPDVAHIWSHSPPILQGTKTSNSTAWSVDYKCFTARSI